VSVVTDRQKAAAPMVAGGHRAHIEAMMNTTTPQVTPDLSQRPARSATLDKETIVQSRQSPWEPGASAGASKILIGLAGAAIVGGIALAVVTMGPPPGAKKVYADRVATAQVARDPAAQMNSEPPAAGTAPATTEPSADTTAKSAETPAATAPTTPAPQATTTSPATTPAPADTSTRSTAAVPPPIVTPAPSPAQPNPDRAPGSTTPTPSE